MNNPAASTSIISLSNHKGEPRVDSRVVAEQLGIQHKAIIQLLRRYQDKLKELGTLPFQMAKSGGRKTTSALLNEDQSYFLLTLSNNTKLAVELKLNLVKAFQGARAGILVEKDYLPFYHLLHDDVKHLAEVAHNAGSQTSERFFHMSFNRMLNTALGIPRGRRNGLSTTERAKITAANLIADSSIREGLLNGLSHKEIYQLAKKQVTAFARSVSGLLHELPPLIEEGF